MFQDSVPAGSYNDRFLSSVCVCVERLNRRKTSLAAYIFIIAGDHRGPGGPVINEDTSPGPV